MPKNIFLYIFLLCLLTITYSIEIEIPTRAASLDVADFDLDGDLDIVVGHNSAGEESWCGITLIENNEYELSIVDTIYFPAYHERIFFSELNDNSYAEIITNYYSWEEQSHKILILNDAYINNYTDKLYIDILHYAEKLSILFAGSTISGLVSIYNTGHMFSIVPYIPEIGFTEPEYFELDFPPQDICTGNLFGDSRDEILVSGTSPLVFYQTETGWETIEILGGMFSEAYICDIDNDGENEILGYQLPFMGDNCTFKIYEINEYGYEQVHQNVYSFPSGLKVFDYNNDNLPDLFLANKLITNHGNLKFSEPVEKEHGVDYKDVFADMDNNGYLDLIMIEYTAGEPETYVELAFNDGKGNFFEEPLTEFVEGTPNAETKMSCYPNPFNPTVNIEIRSEVDNNEERTGELLTLQLQVYNIKGQKVHLEDFNMVAGAVVDQWINLKWNATGHATGVYYCKLVNVVTDEVLSVKKVTLLK
jgi:hypothetical protein